MGKGRRFLVGNHVDGFRELEHKGDFVKFLLPDHEKYAEITIFINDRSELEIRATHGAILIRPLYSNSVEVRSEPLFAKPKNKVIADKREETK